MNRFPIVLPNRQIRRITDHDARLLILGRELAPGLYAVHNAKTERDNRRHRRAGRPDLQSDPHVLTIERTAVKRLKLRDVDDKHARAAGYENAVELRDDWQDRRRALDLDATVFAHTFEISDARYLHAEVHRGYTHDPGQALKGEGAAVDADELEGMARENRERHDRRGGHLRQRGRSLAIRLREATKRGDANAVRDLRRELEDLEAQMRQVAA